MLSSVLGPCSRADALAASWRGMWSPFYYSEGEGCSAGIIPPNGEGLQNLEQYFREHSDSRYGWGPNDWAAHASLSEAIQRVLVGHQAGFYADVIQDLKSATAVNTAVQRLTGRKRALESFIALGLPLSLAHNDYLRALLFGSERLPDTQLIVELYEQARAKLEKGEAVPRVDVVAIARERATALEAVLLTTLDRIAVGEIEEGHPFLAAIQTKMQAMAKAAQVPISLPVPSANQPPVVNAGPDRTMAPPALVTLHGTIMDDGCPRPPGTVTVLSDVLSNAARSFTFDSDDDRVTIPPNANLDVTSPGFTAEFWMRGIKNQPQPLFAPVDKSHGFIDNTGWVFQGQSATGTIDFRLGAGGGPPFSHFPGVGSAVDVLDGHLHHIAGTWDGSTIRLYAVY